MQKANKLIFILEDNTRLNQYNESCKLEKSWYGEQDDGQIMSIDDFYYRCKEFAAAMGFAQKTIEEWFGNY